jgi:hypothetical protein
LDGIPFVAFSWVGGKKVAKEISKYRASRREFIKKAAYIAPAIITLQAAPSYARAGSEKEKPRSPKPSYRRG